MSNLYKICTSPYVASSSIEEMETLFSSYPYKLSDFQKYAIEAIVDGHHVLSCAHTGSGKTLAAEFAINHFVARQKKVIYTSPIKALSNQKYYEFTNKYPHIRFGLLTGDIKTNPNADVLIMTTEILMNRLSYQSNSIGLSSFELDIQNDLACVIFDEVHYINDASRGHVWEQSIMMLPDHVQMVMLSATIDNPVGFSEWVGQCHSNSGKQVWLTTTNHRVVPLTHYMYWATTEEPFKKIKDKAIQTQIRESSHQLIPLLLSSGKFEERSYHKLQNIHHIFAKEKIFMKRKFVLNSLVNSFVDREKSYLQDSDKELLPAIVFVFSRKQVEQCASEITTNLLEFDSKIPYTMKNECEAIVRKFPNANEYLELPEFHQLVGWMEKGIAIHHSGMIPVLREMVEIMISRKMVKLLFATESFAIGLDCPIRSVVFTSLQKYSNDGVGSNGLRYLHSHEYTQMAGRAGRRGIDTLGYVVHLNNLFHENIPLNSYKKIVCGMPQQLVSKFHVNYNNVLTWIQNGNNTYDTMLECVKKTMYAREIHQKIEGTQSNYAEMKKIYDEKTNELESLKTPSEICKKYMELHETIGWMNHKKKKEAEREIQNLKDIYYHCVKDVEKHQSHAEWRKKMEDETQYLEYMLNKIKNDVYFIVQSLLEDGFIEEKDKVFAIHPQGIPAVYSAEIHGIVAGKIFQETNWFSEFSAKEFASFFSCFTQLKVEEEYKRKTIIHSDVDETVYSALESCRKIIEGLEQKEHEHGIVTGNDYSEILHYDLIEEIIEWWDCQSEEECKQFLHAKIYNRGIGIGDFTKAILKIGTIVREWISICEHVGNIDKMKDLSEIETNILKYVATPQSYYV